MVAICTLSSFNSLADLKVFIFTLELFNKNYPTIYLLCDTLTENYLNSTKIYKGQIIINTGLDKYGNINRKRMIGQRGLNYKTVWEDFMMEKATVMDLAFEKEKSVFFFDSDICFMGQLPDIPESAVIGVSQHMIKPADENRYGKFNAGFLWTKDKTVPNKWRQASKTSRFYDQAALEDVVKCYGTEAVFEFPIQNNFGWWRMFQSTESPLSIQKKWLIFINNSIPSVGICINNNPLLSIHTHWNETNDYTTRQYNLWIISILSSLDNYTPAKTLYNFLIKEFPHLHS